ncbi:hypothetical protein Fot_42257 [Forsythia ovata]|uniref:Uncharacterized protein n=1 Tax=Forsythia ovata TaxID=205694 RepID=A0ABD1RKN1_9LAMI
MDPCNQTVLHMLVARVSNKHQKSTKGKEKMLLESGTNKHKLDTDNMPYNTAIGIQGKYDSNLTILDDGLVFTDEDLRVVDQSVEKKRRSYDATNPQVISHTTRRNVYTVSPINACPRSKRVSVL